jgi:hypothetical protein
MQHPMIAPSELGRIQGRRYGRSANPTLRRKTAGVRPRAAGSEPWHVPALCATYNWPTDLEGSKIIAIVELGGGWLQDDVNQYFASIGQPVPHITDISVNGARNAPDGDPNGAESKVALDIQVAGASYYCATGRPVEIRIYWANGIAAAVRAATADGCDVCSILGVRTKRTGAGRRDLTWKIPPLKLPRQAWWSSPPPAITTLAMVDPIPPMWIFLLQHLTSSDAVGRQKRMHQKSSGTTIQETQMAAAPEEATQLCSNPYLSGRLALLQKFARPVTAPFACHLVRSLEISQCSFKKMACCGHGPLKYGFYSR